MIIVVMVMVSCTGSIKWGQTDSTTNTFPVISVRAQPAYPGSEYVPKSSKYILKLKGIDDEIYTDSLYQVGDILVLIKKK